MYKEMMMQAKRDGVANEKIMWESVAAVDEVLNVFAEEHPAEFKKFVRKQHYLMYGAHYNEVLAIDDVNKINYTDKDGKHRKGAYWTAEQIDEATRSMAFPSGTTRWDKYVAFNLWRAKMGAHLDDAAVLTTGHAFFFADTNFPDGGKIFCYMGLIA